jgi:hypothetical protein
MTKKLSSRKHSNISLNYKKRREGKEGLRLSDASPHMKKRTSETRFQRTSKYRILSGTLCVHQLKIVAKEGENRLKNEGLLMPKVIELFVLSGSSVVDCSDVDLLRTAFHHLGFKVLLVGKT